MSYREEIDDIIPYLKNGGLILYPTDTIWGIGCDACNETAIQKIFALKKRSIDKKMVILVADSKMLSHYVVKIHPKINAINDYHERPVTVIYDEAKNLPAINIAPTGSIAIRIVKDEFCQAMIRALGRPIISTSANISGEPFPDHFNEISPEIKNGVNYMVRYKQNDTSKNKPSVIVKLSEKGELNFLRE
jgi:L-threonylcarbamoyladenylate synthase